MKKGWLIALISVAVIVAGAAVTGLVLSAKYSGTVVVTERGVVADSRDCAESNRKALNRILRWARKGTTVVFPEGDYYISASQLGGISLSNKKEITLRGENAVLINTSYSPYNVASLLNYQESNLISVHNAENITIEGLTFDYESPTCVSGVITKAGNGLIFFEAYDEFLTGDAPVQGEEFMYCVNVFDADGNPLREAYLGEDQLLKSVAGEPGQFVLAASVGEVGQQICVRFTSGTYACPALSVADVKGLTVRDVDIRSCPSASVYATGDNSDFAFERVSVAPEADSRSLFASNEDCIHIQGLRGTLTMSDCTFEGIGDDALNVHSLGAVVEKQDGNTLSIVNGRTKEAMTGWAGDGDIIEVYDGDWNLIGTATAVKVKDNQVELDSVPAGTELGVILHNVSRVPTVTIDGCTVKRGRARGFLIQAAEATVTDCTFESLGLSGILIAPDALQWYEMGPCQEATLTGNTFIRCGLHIQSNQTGAICVALNHDMKIGSETAAPHGTITVTGNRFEDCRNAAVFIRGAKKAVVENNEPGDAAVNVQ